MTNVKGFWKKTNQDHSLNGGVKTRCPESRVWEWCGYTWEGSRAVKQAGPRTVEQF